MNSLKITHMKRLEEKPAFGLFPLACIIFNYYILDSSVHIFVLLCIKNIIKYHILNL